jgi:GNAT superfamily N-acetyltransferase
VTPDLRPVTPADRDLLLGIYASTREAELAVVGWDDATKRAFLEQQFTAQDTYYHRMFPDATYDIVELDGQPAGRLYVARRPDDTLIIDIALLPEHRNAGVGTQLLSALAREADAAAKPLTVHVETGGRARVFYERLGFADVERQGLVTLMRRPPAAVS